MTGSRRRTAALLGLLVLGLALRLHTITTGFWHDELLTFTLHARVPFRAIPVLNVDGGDHMFLHFLYHAAHAVFGPHEWAARLPDFCAGMLFLALIGRFSWRIYGDPAAALLTTALVATAPIPVQYSQYARGYGLQMLFALLAYWIAWKGMSDLAWRRGAAEIALGIVAFCGIYNNLTWAFFVIALLAVFLVWGWAPGLDRPAGERRRARRCFVALAAASVLVWIAYQPVLPQTLNEARAQQLAGSTRWAKVAHTYLEFADIATWGLHPGFLLAAFPGLALLWRRAPGLGAVFAGALLVPPAALLAFDKGAPGRHVLFLYPVLAVALGRGTMRIVDFLIRERTPDSARRWRWTAAIGLPIVALQTTFLFTHYFTQWRRNDLGIVREMVRARVGSHDLLAVNIPDSYGLLGYYLGEEIENRMLNIIRDRSLTGLWYAVCPEPPPHTGRHVVRENWIGPEGIPPAGEIAIGRLFNYVPVDLEAGEIPSVPVPEGAARWIADFGAVRLYRIVPERIERLPYFPDTPDREAALGRHADAMGEIAPDLGRVLEGTASLRMTNVGQRPTYAIPPEVPVRIPAAAWWVAFGAVSRRDQIDLDARFLGKDAPAGPILRFRANNCVGPRNHLFGDGRTHPVLRTDWTPACWIGLPPAGDLVLREAVDGGREAWIDGIQSYIVHFKD